MLANVTISVAELANLKPVHCKVLAGLLAFADRAGKCWPSLRTLAEVIGLTLSRVQRAIAEMEGGRHFDPHPARCRHPLPARRAICVAGDSPKHGGNFGRPRGRAGLSRQQNAKSHQWDRRRSQERDSRFKN